MPIVNCQFPCHVERSPKGEVETSHDKHCTLSEIPRLTLGMTEQKKDDRTKENKNKKRTTNLFTNKDKREMKTRTLFVTALLGLGMMASCSNDELEGVDNGQNNNGETTLTQIALSVASSAATKATTGDPDFGKEEEYTVNDLTVLLANENGIVQQIITPDLKPNTGESTNAAKEIRATEPFKVTPGDYYIYVLANYNNSRVALSPIIQGQTALKEIFSIAESSISELSESGNFLMANTTTPTKTTIAERSATSTEIKDDGDPETDNPQTVQLIKVDIERVVGKVTFNQTTTTWTLKNANDKQKEKKCSFKNYVKLPEKSFWQSWKKDWM